MKAIIMIIGITFCLAGCVSKQKTVPPLFKDGQKVQWKGGGPIGVVRYSMKDLNGKYCVTVRFFKDDKNAIHIGVGGSGVVSGGNGIEESSFYDKEFFQHELEGMK